MTASELVTREVVTDRPHALVAAVTDITVLCGRHLKHLRRSPGRFIGITMNPLVILLAMGYLFQRSIVVPGSDDYVEFLFAGVAAQVGLASIGPTAIGVNLDLREGLIDRFRSLPITRASVLLGRTAADLLVSVGALVIITAAGLLLGWRPHASAGSVAAAFGLLVCFIYSMLWVGVVLGLTMRSAESIDAVGSLILVVSSFLSSAFLSVQGLPAWVRPVAEWNPVTAVVSGCRQLFGNPAQMSSAYPGQHPLLVAVAALVVILAVLIPVADRRYRAAVN